MIFIVSMGLMVIVVIQRIRDIKFLATVKTILNEELADKIKNHAESGE
jgi:hypothetical protein